MTRLLVDVDDDMLETVRVMLGVKTKKDTVNGALAVLIAGQDERVRLGMQAMATHNDQYPPADRSDAW
jgi:Arc/MetJ family transcription regulator